jgi:transcriptional regulator with PAS, ATPase and Fis domain
MARPRSSTTALRKTLDHSRRPIYVLDERRVIVYCNQACADWTGIATDDLIGTRCDYHTQVISDPIAELAARLCPPPAVFSGKMLVAEIDMPSKQDLSFSTASCIPLGTDLEGETGVMVILGNPGELKSVPETSSTGDCEATFHQQLSITREAWARDYKLDRLIGVSPLMRRVQQQVRLAIEQPTHVVITGPAGSGREHVARTIHLNHTSKPSSLFPISCPLITPESMQSTVATFVKHCQLEDTLDRSSLMLLDIDQLSLDSQHELTGFFAIPSFRMLTIATSHQCLLTMAEEGTFNKRLALALSTLVIDLPPLSDRGEDIGLLAQAILEDFNAEGNHQLGGFSQQAMDLLLAHTWNDQVDELVEVVRSGCQHAESHVVQATDLPNYLHQTILAESRHPKVTQEIDLDGFLANVESELIERALVESRGNKTKAAQLLGITRARLHRRLQSELPSKSDNPH